MANTDNDREEVTLNGYAVVDAFIDGESVNGAALKHALATPEGRDHLVDLLVLRQTVGAMPPFAVVHAIERRRPLAGPVRWIAAAAVVMMGVLGGYLVGQRHGLLPPDSWTSASFVEIDLSQPSSAPAPTSVIQLKPGLNWKNPTGGR
jgi:hypothetical protein